MKQTLLATLAACMMLGHSSGFAEDIKNNISGGIYLDAAASNRYQQFINNHLLDIGVDPEMSAFKVPANTKIYYICSPVQLAGGQVNPCGKLQQATTRECPTTIPMKWPDGTVHDVAVHCTGPDAQGNCECELGRG